MQLKKHRFCLIPFFSKKNVFFSKKTVFFQKKLFFFKKDRFFLFTDPIRKIYRQNLPIDFANLPTGDANIYRQNLPIQKLPIRKIYRRKLTDP